MNNITTYILKNDHNTFASFYVGMYPYGNNDETMSYISDVFEVCSKWKIVSEMVTDGG